MSRSVDCDSDSEYKAPRQEVFGVTVRETVIPIHPDVPLNAYLSSPPRPNQPFPLRVLHVADAERQSSGVVP